MSEWRDVKIGDVAKHRKGFITIDDATEYKLCRVQLHRKGIVLREVLRGSQIKTKKQQPRYAIAAVLSSSGLRVPTCRHANRIY